MSTTTAARMTATEQAELRDLIRSLAAQGTHAEHWATAYLLYQEMCERHLAHFDRLGVTTEWHRRCFTRPAITTKNTPMFGRWLSVSLSCTTLPWQERYLSDRQVCQSFSPMVTARVSPGLLVPSFHSRFSPPEGKPLIVDSGIARMMAAAEATGAQMLARRQRDYAAEYARRVQRAEARGLSRSQAAGHPRTGERPAREALSAPEWTTTIYAGGPPRVVTVATGYREAQRAGRYMELTRKLNQGDISAGAFRRRVSRMASIAGVDLLSEPRQVLGLVVLTDQSQLVFESKGTPARRKRGRQ